MSTPLNPPLVPARGNLDRAGSAWLRPTEGWSTVVLTALVMGAASQAARVAGWGSHDELVPRICLLGAGVGLLAARSPLRAGWGWLLSMVVGIQWTLVSYALTVPDQGWSDKLKTFSQLVWVWIGAALRDGASYDPFVIDLLLSLAFFLVGFAVSWLVFRHGNGWWALILITTFGLVHLSYATVDSIGPFLWSIFLGMLLVANLGLHRRRAVWESIGVPVQSDAFGWTLVSATMMAGVALFLATRLPGDTVDPGLATSYQQITSPWKGVQRGIDRLVGGSRGQARSGEGLVLTTTLLPREDSDLGGQPVLRIQAPTPLYWRAATYDRYDGRSMQSTFAAEQQYGGDALLPANPNGGSLRTPIELSISVLAPSATILFSADAPVAFSVPATVNGRQAGWDLASVRSTTALQRGETYTVRASVTRAGWRDLEQAGNRYPDWIQPYLELPATLPPRVSALAEQITSGAPNPLDRALAIEAHLRQLTYSTHAVVPTEGRDWVDFLLFDSGSGYSDYFATAMTVLLRTQGIPARVASGFAQGELEEGRNWLVRESDAHSWVEVYFPGYGWQVFEPSAIRGRPERPESALESAESTISGSGGDDMVDSYDDDLDLEDQDTTVAPPPPVVANSLVADALIGLATLVLSFGGLLCLVAFTWERGLRAERPARRRYGQLRRCLGWGGWPVPLAATPVEMGSELARAWPDLAAPLVHLVECHSITTYGRPTPALDLAAETAWATLRGPLARRLAVRRLRQLTARFRRRTS